MSLEERIIEIERKTEIMTQAMLKLQEWMDGVNDTSVIDQTLFDQLNTRISRLEDILVVGKR